jgi:hypothetical protein
MPTDDLRVTVYVRRSLWRRLAWPFVRTWLYAMIGTGRLTGEQAYTLGARFLLGGTALGAGQEIWESLQAGTDGR